MAGGPLYPSSPVFVTSDKVGPGVHQGAASTGLRRNRGIQVVASLDVDADVELTWEMPPGLPTGTGRVRLVGRTTGTGNAVIAIDWVSVALNEDPSAMAYLSQGNSTLTFAAADSDKFKQIADVNLDADSLVANEFVCMRLRMKGSGGLWTLNQILTLQPSIRWV